MDVCVCVWLGSTSVKLNKTGLLAFLRGLASIRGMHRPASHHDQRVTSGGEDEGAED